MIELFLVGMFFLMIGMTVSAGVGWLLATLLMPLLPADVMHADVWLFCTALVAVLGGLRISFKT